MVTLFVHLLCGLSVDQDGFCGEDKDKLIDEIISIKQQMDAYLHKIENIRIQNKKIDSDNKFYEDYYEVLVANIAYNCDKIAD